MDEFLVQSSKYVFRFFHAGDGAFSVDPNGVYANDPTAFRGDVELLKSVRTHVACLRPHVEALAKEVRNKETTEEILAIRKVSVEGALKCLADILPHVKSAVKSRRRYSLQLPRGDRWKLPKPDLEPSTSDDSNLDTDSKAKVSADAKSNPKVKFTPFTLFDTLFDLFAQIVGNYYLNDPYRDKWNPKAKPWQPAWSTPSTPVLSRPASSPDVVNSNSNSGTPPSSPQLSKSNSVTQLPSKGTSLRSLAIQNIRKAGDKLVEKVADKVGVKKAGDNDNK